MGCWYRAWCTHIFVCRLAILSLAAFSLLISCTNSHVNQHLPNSYPSHSSISPATKTKRPFSTTQTRNARRWYALTMPISHAAGICVCIIGLTVLWQTFVTCATSSKRLIIPRRKTNCFVAILSSAGTFRWTHRYCAPYFGVYQVSWNSSGTHTGSSCELAIACYAWRQLCAYMERRTESIIYVCAVVLTAA